MRSLLLVLLCFICFNSSGQSFSITGKVIDGQSQPMIGVSVSVYKAGDPANRQGSATDVDGIFSIPGLSPGNYTLEASYIGYSTFSKPVDIINGDVNAGNITLKAGANALKNVVIEGIAVRAEQHGDTSQFNADAYKTNPDATTEELIQKMPGVTSDANGLKVNGETVQKVLVDGKPFFGDDPAAAIKNLPAEVVDKIQVFDSKSDQAMFSGFDDGNTQKTLNITTKKGRNNGVFGKIYGGGGTDDHYIGGGNINFFNGDRRISIVALANDVNQQNFSSDDLLGVASSSGGGGGMGGGGRRGGGGGGGTGNYGGGGGGAASSFLVPQQGGISQTQSGGINYSDSWGKNLKVTASYFFNRAENNSNTSLNRSYYSDAALGYHEDDTTHSVNYNHRATLRLEWAIDSFNSIILNPRLSYQNNTTNKDQFGLSTNSSTGLNSPITNNNFAKNDGFNLNNNLTIRHKFQKKGRTLSLGIGTTYNERKGNGTVYTVSDSTVDQINNSNSDGTTISGNLTYTEPVSKKSQLMVTYSPSYNKNNSDKETYNKVGSQYSDLDTMLTNKFNNRYYYQNGGLGYNLSDSVMNLLMSVNAQYATLKGTQNYPVDFKVNRNFTSVLPQLIFNYRFSKTENLRIIYRTNNDAPSITQLQNVVNNSNPLLLTTGNPDLNQDYTHSVLVRYGKTGGAKGTGFFVFANATYVNNYIANRTIIASQDTVVRDIALPGGSQLSLPVNLNGYWTGRAFATYAIPVTKIKSNLNINAGFTYSRTPAIINNLSNFSSNYAANGGFVLGSNISENVDFTVSYNGAYNILSNTLSGQTNSKYYSQNASLRFNYIFLHGFVFNTTVTETLYSGLGTAYDKNYFLWNASIGHKFLKNRFEADLYAYDILKQNQSITRTINDSYTEDANTQVLQRYFMLKLTYTIREFKGGGTGEHRHDGGGFNRGGYRGDGPPGGGGGGGFGGPPPQN